jgi:hypothetical protein
VLRAYWHRLSLLQASLAHLQANAKFARKILARIQSSLLPSDPPHFAYSTHLAAIDNLLTPTQPRTAPPLLQTSSASTSPSSSSTISGTPSTSTINPTLAYCPTLSRQDTYLALASIDALRALATKHQHQHVVLLAALLQLRVHVAADDWSSVSGALAEAEVALGMKYVPAVPVTRKGKEKENQVAETSITTLPPPTNTTQENAQSSSSSRISEQTQPPPTTEPINPLFQDPFEAAVALHVVLIGIVYFTHVGAVAEANPRLAHLHAMLDGGALELFPEGTVQVRFLRFVLKGL